jgi:virulence-associated protein VapD
MLDVSRKISEFAQPGEKMSIWGFANRYYVETGLLQGAREATPFYQIVDGTQQDYYLNRYLDDLKRNKPTLFVDATGRNSIYLQDLKYRHENYMQIKNFVTKHYELVASIEDVRIFRIRKQNHKPASQALSISKNNLK